MFFSNGHKQEDGLSNNKGITKLVYREESSLRRLRSRFQPNSTQIRCKQFAADKNVNHLRTPKKIFKCALAVVLAATMASPLAGCRDTDVLTYAISDMTGQYDLDETLLAYEQYSSDADDQFSKNETDSTNQSQLADTMPDYTDSDTTTNIAAQKNIQTNGALLSGVATEGLDSNDNSKTTIATNTQSANNENNSDKDDENQTNKQDNENVKEQGSGNTSNSSSSSDVTNDFTSGLNQLLQNAASSIVDAVSWGSQQGDGNDGVLGDASSDENGAGSNGGDELDNNLEGNLDDGNSDGNGFGDGSNKNGVILTSTSDYNYLPENIKKVIAIGPYATIVQSLSPGSLVASNATWVSSAKSAFGDESINQVASLNSVTPTDDAWQVSASIVEEAKNYNAEVLITDNKMKYGITNEIAQALSEAGISVIGLPTIGVSDDPSSYIEESVQVIGELLKNSGSATTLGCTSKDMAEKWLALKNELQSAAMSNNGCGGWAQAYRSKQSLPWATMSDGRVINKYYAVYFDGWDYDPTLNWSSTQNRTLGGRDYNNSFSLWPCGDWFMSDTGIIASETADYGIATVKARSGYTDKWSQQLPNESVISQFLGYAGVGETTYADYTIHTNTMLIGTYQLGERWLSDKTWYLGNTQEGTAFPYVFVKSKDLIQNLRLSAATASRSANTVNVYNWGKDYKAAVVPSGLDGSWADGYFDSFLIAAWACDLYGLSVDGASYVNDFYSTFFRNGGVGVIGNEDYSTTYTIEVNREG